MKKRHIADDFEAIYLRYNMIKKYMHKADPNALNSPDFKKAIKYLAGRFFHSHKDLFVNHGFEYDDVLSIATVFGLTFMGLEVKITDPKKGRGKYLLMMRYVSQRMNNFIDWIGKKFHTDDMWTVTMEKFDHVVDQYSIDNLPDQLDDQIVPDEHTAKAISDSKEKEYKRYISSCKTKLHKNPKKYRNQLCHYATSRAVSKDVRKKARSLCKKYGINYTKWIEKKLEQNPHADLSQYTF